MANEGRHPDITENPKKHRKLGRKWERERDEWLSSHVMGQPCNCKRLKCFEVTTAEERECLLSHFNSLQSKDLQDSFLASMIKILTIKRRRPRQTENAALLHDHSYSYYIRVAREDGAVSIPVCINALLSIFGIGKARVERNQGSLAKTGE